MARPVKKKASKSIPVAQSPVPPTKRKPGGQMKIKSVKAMQTSIDAYFENTKTEVTARDGTTRCIPGPYTVTGLALAIGLSGRSSLMNYEFRPEFRDAVRRAKSRVEEYCERRLFDREGVQGAKFSLANNFEGWRESAAPSGLNLTVGSVEDAQKFLLGMAGLLEAVEKNVTPGQP